jgi:hypothetical protein
VERLVNATFCLVGGGDFGTGEVPALVAHRCFRMLWGRCGEPPTLVAAGLCGWHAAPGHGGSANRHTDVRGSKPQVGYSQEGAPD